MNYYLSIYIQNLTKEKFGQIVETIEKFSSHVDYAEKDVIQGRSTDISMLSCLLQMKENYPEAHFGFSQYVGIARGLSKIARPGEILVSEEIEQKIMEDYEITSLGMLSIEGMASQILVCRIEQPIKKMRFPQIKQRSFVVPRKREIELLQNLLRVSNAVLVVGPTGSGKTTFLDELVEQWQQKEVFRACCPPYIVAVTLKPITEIVNQMFEVRGKLGIEEKQKTIETRLKEMEITDIGTSYLALLDFLGLGEDESILAKLEVKTRVEVITRTIAEVLKRKSWTKPVAVIIEDVENMDSSSVNFVQHLMNKLAEENVHFVFSSNLTQVDISGLKDFELTPVSKEQLIKLIEDWTGETITLPPTNLFHVIQYLLLYWEEKLSYLFNQYLGQTTITEFGLSFYDIKTIVKRRLEYVGDKKDFLFNLAVAGVEINPLEVPMDKQDFPFFDYFVQCGYLRKFYDHYSFISPLLHREIYNLIPDKEKRHLRLAEYYSRIHGYEEHAAFHYREGMNHKKAIEFMMKAGNLAVKNGAYESSINYYSQALELCRHQGESANLEMLVALNESLADIYRALGDEKKSLKYYKVVLDSYREILKE